MRVPSKAGRPPTTGSAPAIAILAMVSAAIFLSPSELAAAESPPVRLAPGGGNEAEIALKIAYQIPGSGPMGSTTYAKPYVKGDELRPETGGSSVVDAMGTKTTVQAIFGATDVTFTIRQVPGPDRLNPYQIGIHVPFRQNVSGTVDGTKYDVTWIDLTAGENHSPYVATEIAPQIPVPEGPAGPVFSSVPISAKELMMFPHDPQLEFDVEHDSESGSGDWVRFQTKGPAGEISHVFRIQTLSDPGGSLGTFEVAESEVKAVCAPYLPNSREKQCQVQSLKRAAGDIYYCILTNAAFASDAKLPAAQFRNLFVGVFRVGGSVAFVVGNVSQEDDIGLRMLLETLAKTFTIPIETGPPMPVTAGKSDNPL